MTIGHKMRRGGGPLYPVIDSITTKNAASKSFSANIPVDHPAYSAGDLLIVMTAANDHNGGSAPAGWTSVQIDATNSDFVGCAYLIAAGSSGAGTVNFVGNSGSSEGYASICIHILAKDWYGVGGIEYTTAGYTASANPNPPSETASWGSDLNLWIAAIQYNNDAEDVTAYPSGYDGNQTAIQSEDPPATNVGGGCAIATKEEMTATDDPGAFTLSDSEGWIAQTFVIRPK